MFAVRVDGLGLDVVLKNLELDLRLDQVGVVCSLLIRDLAELQVEELLVVIIGA